MLLLFDIDGTLVDTGGAGRRALAAAFWDVVQVRDALDGIRLHGSTDPTILADVFAAHVGRPPRGDDELDAILQAYLHHLAAQLAASDEYVVLPGARELPDAARSSGRYEVGLATGNVEPGAQIKLAHADLWRRFDFGGYGSDAGDRAELVRRGIARGQARAEARFGRRFEADEIWVIGDTERDVTAAHAAGARAVGVLAGSRHQVALRAAGPDLLVDSLESPELWRRLGLEA